MKVLTLTRGLSVDGNTLYITDATTEYGTTLPLRNTLALIALITYKNADGSIVAKTAAGYSPLDVVTFSINVDGIDGVYYTTVFALPTYTSGVIANGTVVWDLNTSSVRVYNAGVLTVVTLESLSLVVQNYGEAIALIDVELGVKKALLEIKMLAELEKYTTNECDLNDYVTAKVNYDYVRAMKSCGTLNFA